MRVIGLTGGIGSGKSTVARMLADAGAIVIDADAVAREVVEPGEPALAEIVARFGSGVLTREGVLDRQALADVVFADPAARDDLERITHPRIGERIAARMAMAAQADEADGRDRLVVLDHPLLVESGLAAHHQVVVVVQAPEERRVERLVGRGMREADARARMAAQADDRERAAVATHLLDNAGDLDHLRRQVDALLEDLGVEVKP